MLTSAVTRNHSVQDVSGADVFEFCDEEKLRQLLEDPLGHAEPTAEQFGFAFCEAETLAARAYLDKDPAAFRLAERLLHVVHALNSFAPPVEGIPGVIWGVLMRKKLATCLDVNGRTGPIDAREMMVKLDAAVARAEWEDHPLLDEVVQSDNLNGLAIYTKNWFASTNGFNHQMIALAQHAPAKVQAAVLKNLGDEYQGTPHHMLRERWLNRLSLKYDPADILRDPDYLIEALSLQNFRTGITHVSNACFALGSFYSVEANFPGVCRRLLTLRSRGFDDASLELFSLHVETDEDHAQEWLDNLSRAELSPRECGFVVDGAICQLRLRHDMFEALRRHLASSCGVTVQ